MSLGEVRAAVLAGDLDAVRRSVAATSDREAAQLWLAWAEGRFENASQLAGPLEAAAASRGEALIVVEAAALKALSLAQLGELEEATKVARRASRMARTEAIPEAEYLAHLVLARIRRLTGGPHLATRILASLRKVAPPSWWPWLDWEAAMSGGNHGPLGAWIAALERGEVGKPPAVVWPPFAADLAAWRSAIDPSAEPAPSIAAWSRGQTPITPPALHGLLGLRGVARAGDTAIAYVLVDGAIRRRVPRLAFAAIDLARIKPEAQTRLKQGRTEMLAAALALAPPEGIAEIECFASVYGFPYEPETHKGIFDVLLHRGREHFGDRATIVRAKGVLQLQLHGPLLIADPRCTRPLGDSLLGVLAEHAGASAKDVAKATGVSLRVVQATLQSLVKDGACQLERGGREIRYLVEDTTFSEPTLLARLKWTADTPASGG